MTHPQHPNQLWGTKWTSRGDRPFRHWEVEVVQSKTGLVRLRAVLKADQILELPWRELRNRDEWEPGWLSTT